MASLCQNIFWQNIFKSVSALSSIIVGLLPTVLRLPYHNENYIPWIYCFVNPVLVRGEKNFFVRTGSCFLRRQASNLCAGLCETEETNRRQVACIPILIFVQVPVGDNEVGALHKVSNKLSVSD